MSVASYASMLFCVVIWGSNFVAGSWLVQQFSPMALPAVRLLMTSTFLILTAWFMHKWVRVNRRQVGLLCAIGLVGTFLNQICFFQAVHHASPTECALVMSTAPIATGLFAFVLLHERFTLRMVAGAIIAIFGVYILVGHGHGGITFSVGDLYATGAMLTFSFNIVLIRKLSDTLDPHTITVYCTILGTFMFLPLATATTPHPLFSHSPYAWIILVLSGVMSQGVAGIMWNRSMKVIGATKASVITNLQPFVAMAVGYFALKLPVTRLQLIGGCLIVFGVVLSTLPHLRLPLPSSKTNLQI